MNILVDGHGEGNMRKGNVRARVGNKDNSQFILLSFLRRCVLRRGKASGGGVDVGSERATLISI